MMTSYLILQLTWVFGMACLLVLGAGSFRNPHRFGPGRIVLAFLLLGLLSLDGLIYLLRIAVDVFHGGEPWPWMTRELISCYECLPFVFSVLLTLFLIPAMVRAKPPLRLTAASVLMSLVALVRGLDRLLGAIYTKTIISLLTDRQPWTDLAEIGPHVIVIVAVLVVAIGKKPPSHRPVQKEDTPAY